ncbi:MAG: nucleoside-diphosphate kinase [Endomicrobiaceae bacterium]
MEKTLVIIKPDAVKSRCAGDIIKIFYGNNLELIGLKMIRPSKTVIENFYSVHKEKDFFKPLVEFMISGKIIVCIWSGDNAVFKVREIIGSTDSRQAKAGTIRNLFGTNGRVNAVHASDSLENAEKEISFFFEKTEIFEN